MRYWDASGLVCLLVRQPATGAMEALLATDRQILTWWGTRTECYSALMRLVRSGHLTGEGVRDAERRLELLAAGWNEVVPSEAVRRTAERMLRVHRLRAADALQLAAALIAADHSPDRLAMVCLDERLGEAARREGFPGV